MKKKLYVSREERQDGIPKADKATKKFNALIEKIIDEHAEEILKLLARAGYYEYSKGEDGELFFTPTPLLIRKIAGGFMYLYKKDGYLNEIYVDNNEEELDQESFHAIMWVVVRCFPDIIFPTQWFGNWDKKEWIDVQIAVIAHVFAACFIPNKFVKDFFNSKLYEQLPCLLDWYVNVKKVSESKAFSLVAGELCKSASYVRDHCNDDFFFLISSITT